MESAFRKIVRLFLITSLRAFRRNNLLGLFLIFALAPGDAYAGCVLKDGAAYNSCNLSPSQIFFCGAGRFGKKLVPCHSVANKSGYCCQAGKHPYCKSDTKSTSKWYYYTGRKWKYCKSIFVRPANETQCIVSIAANSCPFARSGKAGYSRYFSSSTGTKYKEEVFYANGWPSNPPPTDFNLDTNDSGYKDDDSNLWVDSSARAAFRLVNKETSCPQTGNDYCGQNFTTDKYFDYQPSGPPTAKSTVSSFMLNAPYHIDSVSDPVSVLNALAAGAPVAFNDRKCDSESTPALQATCCVGRTNFWLKFCSLYRIRLARKAPFASDGTRLCEKSDPDNAKCTYSGFDRNSYETGSTAITTSFVDPNP